MIVSEATAAKSLLSAAAVRERAHKMLALGEGLPNFQVDLARLDGAAQLVIDTTRAAYPTLDIPFHSRWRHFELGGLDYWNELDQATAWPSAEERARTAFDLAIVSVLLDAGAGPNWKFRYPPNGETIGRSEGLALASLVMFRDGEFSMSPGRPLRVDGSILAGLPEAKLARGFQVSDENPLQGVAGRADLLRRLGRTVMAAPEIFGRNDTMVKLRGVNVFPEAIGAIVSEDARTNGEYVCVLESAEGGRETMTVMVETSDQSMPRGVIEGELADRLKEALGVRLQVQAVGRGGLDHLTGLSQTSKIKRLIDRRRSASS